MNDAERAVLIERLNNLYTIGTIHTTSGPTWVFNLATHINALAEEHNKLVKIVQSLAVSTGEVQFVDKK